MALSPFAVTGLPRDCNPTGIAQFLAQANALEPEGPNANAPSSHVLPGPSRLRSRCPPDPATHQAVLQPGGHVPGVCAGRR